MYVCICSHPLKTHLQDISPFLMLYQFYICDHQQLYISLICFLNFMSSFAQLEFVRSNVHGVFFSHSNVQRPVQKSWYWVWWLAGSFFFKLCRQQNILLCTIAVINTVILYIYLPNLYVLFWVLKHPNYYTLQHDRYY